MYRSEGLQRVDVPTQRTFPVSSLHTLSRYANHLIPIHRAPTRLSNPRSSAHSLPEVYSNNRSRPASCYTTAAHTPTPSAYTPSSSSYPASLGYSTSDRYRAQPTPSPPVARNTPAQDFAALKATMEGLGVELPDQTIAHLAKRYDGVTPMERFLSEEGYWVPGSRGQVSHPEGSTDERRPRRG